MIIDRGLSSHQRREINHLVGGRSFGEGHLRQLCREGSLYDVERWIADGKPLQLAPEAIGKGTRPKTALQIALETGQHSLASLLLKSGYRRELDE